MNGMSGEKLIADRPNGAGHEAKRLFSQDTRIFAALVWPLHIHFPAETGLNALPGGARLAGLAVSLLGLAGVSRAGDFDSLGATGVTLYEISERVTFDPDPSSAGMIRRNATSPLQGFAEVGTPLCPAELLVSVLRIQSCTIIATGTDSASTVTGLGPVSGTFDVVINAPGNSSRMADPTTGMLGPIPQPVVLPFNGTFRMPFAIDTHGRHVRSDRKHAAFYLADDLRTPILVRPTELSASRPCAGSDVRPVCPAR